jgi:hypothetical protein
MGLLSFANLQKSSLVGAFCADTLPIGKLFPEFILIDEAFPKLQFWESNLKFK